MFGAQFAAKVLQVLIRQPAFEKGARINAGRGVTLKIDDVAVAVLITGAKEVVEADFIERRRRSVGRDVAADAALFAVGAHDH